MTRRSLDFQSISTPLIDHHRTAPPPRVARRVVEAERFAVRVADVVALGGAWEGVIPTATVPLRYGLRPWLICPRCSRRCAAVYPVDGAPPTQAEGGPLTWLACRRCVGLAYLSQRLRPLARLDRRAQRIAGRVGALEMLHDPVASPLPPRPSGMHRRTYQRHAAQLQAVEARTDALVVRALCGRLSRRPAGR